jgi:hypothetical protein
MALLWTAPADVRDRWVGDAPLDATDAQLSTLLEDAEDTVLREFPDLPDRVDAEGGIPELRVRKVVARVVIRHLRNPEGLRQVQEGAGPYTENRTYGGVEPGALYLTDADRAELSAAHERRAFTIDQSAPLEHSGEIAPDSWYQIA